MIKVSSIEYDLSALKEGLKIVIKPDKEGSLFDGGQGAVDLNEPRYQVLEGHEYHYEINQSHFEIGDVGFNIIKPHKTNSRFGRIVPNIYTGTLDIPVFSSENPELKTTLQIEVQSVKTGYRDDYRDMLEYITEKCTDLLMQASSPTSHRFEIDYETDNNTLYQRFSFVRSIIQTDEFLDAVHRIITSPVTKWTTSTGSKDIRGIRRLSKSSVKELISDKNRVTVPSGHFIASFGFNSMPQRIQTTQKVDSPDTLENRFVKHSLTTIRQFCEQIYIIASNKRELSRLKEESQQLISVLDSQLQHSFFSRISDPTTLKLNSPVLQRKEGYREILRVWLMFDLAAKLVWKGGDDVYGAGKKDIATLYEYWLFFVLLDLFSDIFSINPEEISKLIQSTSDGLSLELKQGRYTPLKGIFKSESRELNIKFSYNRSFSGKKNYPDAGSWTTTLRPDYTLSIWPSGISESVAEEEELIVHVHFDAKYKISNLWEISENLPEESLNEEKKENLKGNYKNADLLKMHAYKDAIRRTGGAYVLYPGDATIDSDDHKPMKGFHELIPGLGAFPVRPHKTSDGTSELRKFILELIDHFINRTTQREKQALRTFQTYKTPPESDSVLREPLPEPYSVNRDLLPDETFVLIGFYNSVEHLNWIKATGLYNFRTGTKNGSIPIDIDVVRSKYLLLHTYRDQHSGELWKIKGNGFKIYTKQDLVKTGYPTSNPDESSTYFVTEIEKVTDKEFKDINWSFKELKNYKENRESAKPFTASLAELMRCKVKI